MTELKPWRRRLELGLSIVSYFVCGLQIYALVFFENRSALNAVLAVMFFALGTNGIFRYKREVDRVDALERER